MQGFLLQPWITVQSPASSSFIQDVEQWLDVRSYAGCTFWVDVAAITLPTVTGYINYLALTLQTSPSEDESLFMPVSGPLIVTAASSTPMVTKSVTGASTAPLARWLRWQLAAPPLATGSWGMTFRIRVAPTRQSFFVPTQLPSCVLWLRADLGITLDSTGAVSQWNDQTGDASKNLSQATAVHRPYYTPSDSTFYVGTASGQVTPGLRLIGSSATGQNLTFMTAPAWTTPVLQPITWITVAYNTSAGTLQYVFDGDDASHGQAVEQNASNDVVIFANGSSVTTSTGLWSSTAAVLLAEFNTTSSKIYWNNFTTASASGTLNGGTAGGQGSLTFGEHSAQFSGGNNWIGSVAEIIAFSGTLSTTSKGLLRKYLTNRYGIQIS